MTPVVSPYTPIVSTTIGSNWCASARAAYLRRLRSSALFVAVKASIADLFRCTSAKVSTHVQYQTKLLPPLNGKTDIPSGRDPSPLSNPGGSKTDGMPAFWSALLITSFIAECFGKRPALYLQDKTCKLLLSILPPQRQEWGIQTSAPTLRAMAALKLSGSSSVSSDETCKALSQAYIIPLFLNNRKAPGLLTSWIIRQGSTTTSPPREILTSREICYFVVFSCPLDFSIWNT